MKLGIPAIKTSPIQFIYNPIQVIACSYMFMETAIQAYRNGYSPAPCNAFKADNPVMGNVLYLFYLSKMLDLCDTFFIVVGKKWRQLSFLHVYHHLSVLLMYYIVFRVAQDGDSYASVVLNGFVHTIMYTYYFVSAHTRDIWWKRYLTLIQLVQFVTMNIQGYFMYSRQCPGMPPKIPLIYLAYVQSLFWLFVNFYVRSYVLGPKKVSSAKKTLVCTIHSRSCESLVDQHRCSATSLLIATDGSLIDFTGGRSNESSDRAFTHGELGIWADIPNEASEKEFLRFRARAIMPHNSNDAKPGQRGEEKPG
ncbi:unnamed protein product [Phytophthora lilii]|uniref:Elongation of fatty acids protein n=1 Tax=Phytophthora lilii TaxID=2077276 RepID=A0A9W6TFC4_9STRA|nr:unnamed protein product [Phytophthora lilii]